MSRHAMAAAITLSLAGCGRPTWPADRFPRELEVERTLFRGGGGFSFRESCEAMVVEINDGSTIRMIRMRNTKTGREAIPTGQGWKRTPVAEADRKHASYQVAFGGCDNDGSRPLGDLPGALERPDSYYKVINGGEGIAIINPSAKLAGFFYFG